MLKIKNKSTGQIIKAESRISMAVSLSNAEIRLHDFSTTSFHISKTPMSTTSFSEIYAMRRKHASLGTIFRNCRKKYPLHGDIVLIRSILLHFRKHPDLLGKPSHNERRAMLRLVVDDDPKTARSCIGDFKDMFREKIEWGKKTPAPHPFSRG